MWVNKNYDNHPRISRMEPPATPSRGTWLTIRCGNAADSLRWASARSVDPRLLVLRGQLAGRQAAIVSQPVRVRSAGGGILHRIRGGAGRLGARRGGGGIGAGSGRRRIAGEA